MQRRANQRDADRSAGITTVAGALGVAHVVRLIREELELAMALAGCARIADIDPRALFTPATGEAPRSAC